MEKNRKIKADLQYFYDCEAKKYYETRKKKWQEWENVLKILEKLSIESRKLRILELGCGSGRFVELLINWLNSLEDVGGKDIKIEYVGVDLSKELLKYAEKIVKSSADGLNVVFEFYQWDMIDFLESEKQENYDLVVGFASIQHLTSWKERLLLMKMVYRVLKYDGSFLMINWRMSKWFICKYWKNIVLWVIQMRWRDVLVPWVSNGKRYDRFYHLFGKKELEKLALYSGLKIKELEMWERNSWFLWTKWILG